MNKKYNYISVFKRTIYFFYEECSKRIDQKIQNKKNEKKRENKENQKFSLTEIYSDEKLISRIRHNNRYEHTNKYLLTNSVIYEGLLPNLFDNDIQALLWGTDEEISKNLPLIFQNIMLDLVEGSSSYEIDIRLILSDYAPYAFDWTVTELIQTSPLEIIDYPDLINVSEIFTSLPHSQQKAITFLYQKCKPEFEKEFFEFCKTTRTYQKLDHLFEEDFIKKRLIPLLKKYIPKEDSIGLRVRNLILNDISKIIEVVKYEHPTPYSDFCYKLISLSAQYANALIDLQVSNLNLFF